MVSTTVKEAFYTWTKRKTMRVGESQQAFAATMDHLAYRDHGVHSPTG
jgi:hypothetical protein